MLHLRNTTLFLFTKAVDINIYYRLFRCQQNNSGQYLRTVHVSYKIIWMDKTFKKCTFLYVREIQ